MQLWRVMRARLQHPGHPYVTSGATHGMGLVCQLCAWQRLAPGQVQEGGSPGSDGFPRLQTWWWPCVRGPVSPPGPRQAVVQKWSQRA